MRSLNCIELLQFLKTQTPIVAHDGHVKGALIARVKWKFERHSKSSLDSEAYLDLCAPLIATLIGTGSVGLLGRGMSKPGIQMRGH